MSTQPQVNDPALIANRPVSTRSRLDPQAIEWMILCCAQDKAFLTDTRQFIQPSHFFPREAILRLAYEAILYCSDTYGGVSYETLATTTQQLIEQDDMIVISPSDRETLFRPDPNGLLHQLAHPVGVEFNRPNLEFGRTILRKFAEERLIHAPLLHFLNPGRHPNQNCIPEQLDQFLGTVHEHLGKLTSLKTVPLIDVAPAIGSTLVKSHVFKETGHFLVDDLLGGQCVGDCNGLIGPTGGGKTTLGLDLATACANQCWKEATEQGLEQPEVVVYVTVEESAIKLRPRIWSTFFEILRSRVENLEDWNQLSQPGALEEYEIANQSDQEYKLSEIERYQAYSPALASCFKLLDLSGSNDFPDAGEGFVAEVASYITRIGQPVRMIIIDYAGLLCQRFADAQGLDEYGYRNLLKNFGQTCRKDLSEKFSSTTWVLHQLKSELGSASPTKLMSHTDAEGSKAFATNMAVCGCLSPEDKNTGVRQFNWSKNRHRPNAQTTAPLLRIHSDYARFEDVSSQFVANTASRQILTAEDASRLQQEGAAQTRTTQVGPGIRDTSTPNTTEFAAIIEETD